MDTACVGSCLRSPKVIGFRIDPGKYKSRALRINGASEQVRCGVFRIIAILLAMSSFFQIENIPAHHPQDDVVSSQDKRDLFSFLSFQMITDLFRNGTTKHFNR